MNRTVPAIESDLPSSEVVTDLTHVETSQSVASIPLFELVTLVAVSVIFAVTRKELPTNGPILWWAINTLLIVTLLWRTVRKPHGGQALWLFLFGLGWCSGIWLLFTNPQSRGLLLYAAAQSFLLGSLLPAPPSKRHVAAVLLTFGAGTAYSEVFVWPNHVIGLSALLAGCGWLISVHLRSPRYLRLSRRAGILLLTCSLLSTATEGYFLTAHVESLVLSHSPFLSTTWLSNIEHRLEAAAARAAGPTQLIQGLQEEIGSIARVNPRAEMRVVGADGISVALSPYENVHESRQFDRLIERIPRTEGPSIVPIDQSFMGTVPLGNDGQARLVVGGESFLSRMTLRKVAQRSAVILALCATLIAIAQSIAIFRWLRTSVSERFRIITEAISAIREGKSVPNSSVRQKDEISAALVALTVTAEAAEHARSKLAETDRATCSILEATRDTIADYAGRIRWHLKEGRSTIAGAPAAERAAQLTNLNYAQDRLLRELTSWVSSMEQHSSGEAFPVPLPLRSVIEDAYLELISGPRRTYHISTHFDDVSPEVVVAAEELPVRLLFVLAFEMLLPAVTSGPGDRIALTVRCETSGIAPTVSISTDWAGDLPAERSQELRRQMVDGLLGITGAQWHRSQPRGGELILILPRNGSYEQSSGSAPTQLSEEIRPC